jgi:O-antigen ligase
MALPQRDLIIEAQSLAGQSPGWAPLSAAPQATWLSVLSTLPALALFLSILQLDFAERRLLTLAAIGIGVVSAFIGLAQVSQGPFSALRILETAHKTEAVGFFANRNHFAAFLYCSLILLTAWLIHALLEAGSRGPQQSRAPVLLAAAAVLACQLVIIGAIAMARSRAGLALTIASLVAAVVLAMSNRRAMSGLTPVKAIAGVSAIAAVLIAQFALYRLLERFALDPLGDERFAFARTTIAAAKAYWPFGSGLGSFVPVYGVFQPVADLRAPNVFVNHAHNDLLEIWLETGILGVILLACALLWFLARSYAVWWRAPAGEDGIDRLLARGGSVVVLLLALHSLVDYPLRTTAMMSVFALACALLVPPPRREDAAQERTTTRRVVRSTTGRPASASVSGLPASPADLAPPRAPAPWGTESDWPDAWKK